MNKPQKEKALIIELIYIEAVINFQWKTKQNATSTLSGSSPGQQSALPEQMCR